MLSPGPRQAPDRHFENFPCLIPNEVTNRSRARANEASTMKSPDGLAAC
jgi:hypothetical protein